MLAAGPSLKSPTARSPRPSRRAGPAGRGGDRYRGPMTGRHRDDAFDGPPPADPVMTMTTVPVGAALVVEVVGELDLHTAPDLMATIDDALQRPGLTRLIIDLSRVTFLGSSGLGVLANLATRATAPDRAVVPLRIVAPAEHHPVARPWEAMNLQQILPLYPDIGAATAVD